MNVHRFFSRLLVVTSLITLLCLAPPLSDHLMAQPAPILQSEPLSYEFLLSPYDSLLADSLFVFDSLGQAVSFWTYNASDWLYLDTLSVVPLVTPLAVPVWVTAVALAPGVYVDTIFVWGEGAANSLAIPVMLSVLSTDPVLEVFPGAITLSLPAGDSASGFFHVSEALGGAIPFSCTNSLPWLTLWQTFTPADTPDSVEYLVSASSLAPGSYSDTILIWSDEAVNSPLALPVNLTVTEPSPIDLRFSPYWLHLTLPVEDTVATAAWVWSTPSNGVPFWMTAGAPWITVNETATYVTPAYPQIRVSSFGLAPGEYHDTVFFHTDSLVEPGEYLPVTLTVIEGDYTIQALAYRTSWVVEEDHSWNTYDTLNVWSLEGVTVNFTVDNNSSWLRFDTLYRPPLVTPRSVMFSVVHSGLAPGLYYDTIVVTTPTALNPEIRVPVALTVTEASYEIQVSRPAIDLLLPGGTVWYGDSLYVYDTGGDSVEFLVSNHQPWLEAGGGLTLPLSTPSFLPLWFHIDTLPLGTYFDTVTIEPAVDCGPGTDCPVFDPVQVPITLTLSSTGAQVAAAPSSFYLQLAPSEIVDSAVYLFETHGQQVPFLVTTSPGYGWLQPLIDSLNTPALTPATVPFRVTTTFLSPGVYADTLVFADPTEGPLGWPTVKVPVVITVTSQLSQLVAVPNRFAYTLQPYDSLWDHSVVFEQAGQQLPVLAFDTDQPFDFLRVASDTLFITPDSLWFLVAVGNWPPGTYVDSILLMPLDDTAWYGNEYIRVQVTIPGEGDAVDSLLFPSMFGLSPCHAVQPIALGLSRPIKGASIPVKIPPGVTVDSISFDGFITADWDFTTRVVHPDSGFIHLSLANSFGEVIPTGRHTVANIHFTLPDARCGAPTAVVWDTALMSDPTRHLLFADTANNDLPAFFLLSFDISYVAGYQPGDFDCDSAWRLTDLTRMINFLFLGGPPPCVLNALDVNGSCTGPNISDVTFLVDFLFLGGSSPRCGCLSGLRAAPRIVPGLVVTATVAGGKTRLHLTTPEPLRGIELYLEADPASEPILLAAGTGLEMLSGRDGALLHIGILDIDGDGVLPAGTERVLEIEGLAQVASALGSDMKHGEVAVLSTAPETLPEKYVLYQNYPNPFNPTTDIRFGLPVADHARLTIYNVVGQQITILLDKDLAAGDHTVTWDGTDSQGRELATGIYLYRLETASWSESRKMLLLK